MHLCANVLLGRLLPAGTLVRRSFSFQRGEKSLSNVLYRRLVDRILARRHRLVHHFFSLAPLEPAGRLQRIFALAREGVVEVETHPVREAEYRFLTGGEILRPAAGVRLGPFPGASAGHEWHGDTLAADGEGQGENRGERAFR
jgi:hypothetical protein